MHTLPSSCCQGILVDDLDINLEEYSRVNDNLMDVISSLGSSLFFLDLSGSDVTNSGLIHLQVLNINYNNQISDKGLVQHNELLEAEVKQLMEAADVDGNGTIFRSIQG